MLNLTLAAVTFAAMHLLIAGTRARDALTLRLGERRYLALFSLASAAVLWWLIAAYLDARRVSPSPLYEYRQLAALPMLLAFVFVALGLMTPAPTAVGAEKLLQREDGARGIHRVTRHPFLWGVALWAATHAVFNPEPANLVFFGTFLLIAVAGTASIDAKRARRHGEAWQRYAARTSNVPFAAIATRRNTLAWRELGLLKVLAAVAAFVAFVLLHARFFGLSSGL